MNLVYAIKVGGELHSVEATEHDLEILWPFPDEIGLVYKLYNISEQCDECGAGGSESYYQLVTDATPFPYYECAGCQRQYTVVRAHPRDTVFPLL